MKLCFTPLLKIFLKQRRGILKALLHRYIVQGRFYMFTVAITLINEKMQLLMDWLYFHDAKCKKPVTILPGYQAGN